MDFTFSSKSYSLINDNKSTSECHILDIYCIVELCNGRRAYYVCHCIIKYDIVRRDTNRKSFYSYLFSLHIQGNILIELFMAIGLMMYHSEYNARLSDSKIIKILYYQQ